MFKTAMFKTGGNETECGRLLPGAPHKRPLLVWVRFFFWKPHRSLLLPALFKHRYSSPQGGIMIAQHAAQRSAG